MKQVLSVCVAALLAAGAARAAAPAKKASADAGTLYKVDRVTLQIQHRVFHDFKQTSKVQLHREFPIGDTEYSGQIVDYVPDFAMVLSSKGSGPGKVITRSQDPKNPAFRIVVKSRGKNQDTTWAMVNMPPHFARKSLLAFKVLRIDFVNHAPVVNPDTVAAAAGGAGKP